jgi:hypothetical protein
MLTYVCMNEGRFTSDTKLHTNVHIYIHAYMDRSIPGYNLAYIYTCTHTYIYTHTHPYIGRFIQDPGLWRQHTYVLTYTHMQCIYIDMYLRAETRLCGCVYVCICMYMYPYIGGFVQDSELWRQRLGPCHFERTC